ncbi:MAG: hypothetical protein A2Y94_10420 [Caldithrix sp. RBG_13_44_9]|nr:MAG: hypothetical protein A2Y94_10420 [Caldithrix sp. RBG_13_44_9]
MKYWIYGFFLFCLPIFWDCASHPIQRTSEVKFTTLAQWPSFYRQIHLRLQSLKSEARISLESPSLATTITVALVFTAPDTLFMQAEGFLGMDLGKIFIGKDRFILYNQFNNQFLAGSVDDPLYSTFLETSLTLRQLKNAFIGFAPLPEDIILIDEEQGLFRSQVDQQESRYKVNKQDGTLEWMEYYQDGKMILKQEFKNYSSYKGLFFPRLTRIILPQRKEMVAILHKNIKINEAIDSNSYFIEIGPKTRQLIIAN